MPRSLAEEGQEAEGKGKSWFLTFSTRSPSVGLVGGHTGSPNQASRASLSINDQAGNVPHSGETGRTDVLPRQGGGEKEGRTKRKKISL